MSGAREVLTSRPALAYYVPVGVVMLLLALVVRAYAALSIPLLVVGVLLLLGSLTITVRNRRRARR